MTTAAPTTDVTADDQPWQRLSIRMLAVHPVAEFGRALPAIVALFFVGSSNGHGGWWSLGGLAFAIVFGLLRWATTRYRISPSQIQVRRGLVNQRLLTVPRDRVRSVDVTSHVLHRLLGLARVSVGTGQSDRQRQEGIVLDGLSRVDAARLRDELLHSGRGPSEPVVAASAPVRGESVLAAFAPRWIGYGPFTMSGLVTVGVAVAFGWRIVSEAHVDPERFGPLRALGHQLTSLPLVAAGVEAILLGLVVVAVFSTLGYLLAFWNFRLTRSASGTLHISRGLLTTRATTIEERRLRGVELSEPLLLRAVRGARCIAITTGLRVGRGAERGGSLILPPTDAAQARRVGADVLGSAEPLTVTLTRHPRAALRRRLTRVLVAAVILTGLAGWVSVLRSDPSVVVATAVVCAVLGVPLAVDRYRSLGHAVIAGRVVFAQGSLVRRRAALNADGVIGFTLRQSIFQRPGHLVTLTATTAAGRQRYELLDVRDTDAVAIADRVLPGVLTPFLVRG